MRRKVVCSVLVVLFHFLVFSSASQPWWSLGFDRCATDPTNCTNCADTHVFNTHQEEQCSRHGNTEVVKAISKGALDCIRQCQKKFNNTQWNCTTFNGEYLFGRFIENITRETAVVNSFLSAGAALAVAEACHTGVIDGCPCIASTNYRDDDTTFLHQCNDNVEFAIGFVKNLYNLERSTTKEDVVTRWNNKLGYEAVNRTSTYCRCIGLSGSCVLQSCYQRAPTISEIACELRKKYDGSQKVVEVDSSLYLAGNPDIKALPDFPVHLRNTPNLCIPSPEDNILGTRGRRCEPSISGPDSCSSLCCNNGFESFTYEVPVETCRFVWCCRIECVLEEVITKTGYRCL